MEIVKGSKTETLLYHSNLSEETTRAMADIRAKAVAFSAAIEALGSSREISLAFTHVEESLFYAMKHLCLIDSGAVKVPLGQ
jgi:hypothetical protein